MSDPSNHSPREPVEKIIEHLRPDQPNGTRSEDQQATVADLPWVIQQRIDGAVELDRELNARHKNMPVFSTVKFRNLGSRQDRAIATMATQDGSAQVLWEVDSTTRQTRLSFTFGAMLTLRFDLLDLSDTDRITWVQRMQSDVHNDPALLMGPGRWEKDFLIGVTRPYFTDLFAFSAYNFDAAVRLTPDTTRSLFGWLSELWHIPDLPGEDDLLTTW